MQPISDADLLLAVETYHQLGNQRAAAAELGIVQSALSHRIKEAKHRGLYTDPAGALDVLETTTFKLPPKGKVKRYLLTSAQNRTKLHSEWWRNLLAVAETYDAKVMVSTFRYNKDAMGQRANAKRVGTDESLASEYAKEIVPYIVNERIDIAPNLTFCGELQIPPTNRRPLSGFETYTYRRSTIIPHTTIALRSVASMKGEGVKLLYTTGCVTQRNYIKRREGFRAEHFHAYSALLVEVDHTGAWWCRHVQQGEDGTVYDLTNMWKAGKLVTNKARVECITWGDIHAAKVDDECARASWGNHAESMLESLRPRSQHMHDLLDMTPLSHHTRKDPVEMFRNYVHAGRNSLARELRTTADVASQVWRSWCRTVDVNSNHTRHLDRMLKEVDWRTDPENAEMILDLVRKVLVSVRTGDKSFYLPEEALRATGLLDGRNVIFLREDQSDVILKDQDGGIECGLHGDRGVNGSKGTASGIARMGRRVNMADKHATEIIDGVYVAGTSGLLDAGFNKGPSSWTHAHIVTNPNGTRAIYSIWKGKWRA